MVNVDKLRGKIVEKRMSVEKVAEAIGLDVSTLYRKLKYSDKLTIGEASKISKVLELTAAEVNDIFFAHFVA